MSPSLTVVVGTILAATVLSLVVPVWWTAVTDRVGFFHNRPGQALNGLLLQVLALAGAVLVFVPNAPAIEWGVPSAVGIALIFAGSPVLFVLAAVFAGLTSLVDVSSGETGADEMMEMGNPLWFLVAAVLVGPAEELLFRGLVQTLLVDVLGTAAGLVCMGALFALYHYPMVADSPLELDVEGLLEITKSGIGGIMFGMLYLYTGNLLVPIVGHSLHDAVLFALLVRRNGSSETDGSTDTIRSA